MKPSLYAFFCGLLLATGCAPCPAQMLSTPQTKKTNFPLASPTNPVDKIWQTFQTWKTHYNPWVEEVTLTQGPLQGRTAQKTCLCTQYLFLPDYVWVVTAPQNTIPLTLYQGAKGQQKTGQAFKPTTGPKYLISPKNNCPDSDCTFKKIHLGKDLIASDNLASYVQQHPHDTIMCKNLAVLQGEAWENPNRTDWFIAHHPKLEKSPYLLLNLLQNFQETDQAKIDTLLGYDECSVYCWNFGPAWVKKHFGHLVQEQHLTPGATPHISLITDAQKKALYLELREFKKELSWERPYVCAENLPPLFTTDENFNITIV